MIHSFSMNFTWMPMISKSKSRHRDRMATIVFFFFHLALNENKVYWLNSMLSLNMWLITWSYAYGINITKARLSSKISLSIRTSTRVMPSFSGSRFQLQLVNDEHQMNNDQSHLRVVEISSFKHLTHLSLLVTSANDHEIKNYLARRLQSKTVRLTRSVETRRFSFHFHSGWSPSIDSGAWEVEKRIGPNANSECVQRSGYEVYFDVSLRRNWKRKGPVLRKSNSNGTRAIIISWANTCKN